MAGASDDVSEQKQRALVFTSAGGVAWSQLEDEAFNRVPVSDTLDVAALSEEFFWCGQAVDDEVARWLHSDSHSAVANRCNRLSFSIIFCSTVLRPSTSSSGSAIGPQNYNGGTGPIRWPGETVVESLPDWHFIRINLTHPEVPSKLGDRAIVLGGDAQQILDALNDDSA